MRKIFFILAGLCLSTAAHAGPFTCYLEATVGSGTATSKLAIDPVASIDGLSSKGWLYAPGAGCDYYMDKMLIGIMGRRDFGHVDTTASVAFLPPGSTDFSVRINNQYLIAGRVGMQVSPATVVYGLAGISGASLDTTSIGGDKRGLRGKTIGAGVEWIVTGPWSAKFEYTFTQFDKTSFEVAPTTFLDVTTQSHAVRAGMTYRFTGSVFDDAKPASIKP